MPRLGDIASGTLILENQSFIKLIGPDISISLQQSPAKDALINLAKLGNYGFIYVKDINRSINSNNKSENPKLVTLSFKNESYSKAFNSILLSSGLQAKKEGNLIIVGENVLGKSFGPQVSKVYRMNQASAGSAADYLASLGATINKVKVLTQDSSSGASSTKTNNSRTYIDTYSATSGPLRGRTGTTDSRLQTITLIGSTNLISVAEKYLKQLDLRQRQVALSIKILDVDLQDSKNKSNNLALRTGNSFIVNENGSLSAVFGSFLPGMPNPIPTQSISNTNSNNRSTSDGVTSTSSSSNITSSLTSNLIPNPGLALAENQLYNYLTARITSSSTKVLAKPTIILSENNEKISGGQEVTASIDGGGAASIGRPFANESFVTVGTRVITDFSITQGQEGASPTCQPKFSNSGITFGARVHKIDDNGYVTFSLSPKLSSIDRTRIVPNCGEVSVLNVRRLDTGTLRVKDSQTLVLTGVIQELETDVITKVPLMGDLPLLGNLFKTSSKGKRKGELVIMVTPKIIDDSEKP